MNIVKERFEQWYEERRKQEMRELLKEAIQEGVSQEFIDHLIKKGSFSKVEVEGIYQEIEGR